MQDLTAGIDLGGTNVKVALVDAAGKVVRDHSIPTGGERGPEAVAGTMCAAVRECMARAGADLGNVAGVGIGSPGVLDLEDGVVIFAPNLPGFRDVPLRNMVEQGLGLPCVLDNDANVAALAEQWVGAGRGCSTLVLLTLGTGVGSGIVLDGRIWHGMAGVAGEVGHMSICPDGPECGCGNRGCFETYASATGMVRRMREAIAAGTPSSLAGAPDEITARAIHEAAVAGDTAARENVEQTGRYLGLAVSNLMHLLNPEVIAFSGGVTAAGDMLMEPLLDEVRWRTLEPSQRGVKVCFSELPEDAGVLGAARCFMVHGKGID